MSYGASFNPISQSQGYSPAEKGSKYVDPNYSLIPQCNSMSLEKERIRSEWKTFLNNFGFRIMYQRNGYSLENHDFLLGEDPTSPYTNGKQIKGYLEIPSSNWLFTGAGIENRKEIILTIGIEDFESMWGDGIYPSAGDLFYVVDMVCEDPEKETPEVYKITGKNDGQVDVDFLFGSYIWKLNAIRFDYSFEPNAFKEEGSIGPNDSNFMGILSGGVSPVSEEKPYSENVDVESEKDYSNKEESIYGNFI